MDLSMILINSLWCGLFAAAMATLLTAPPRYLVATFVCGLAGRLVRDLLTGWGMGSNWSTVLAAVAVVMVAVAFIRRQHVSPVVLVCGVLPLGSALAMFNAILELMKLSTAKGDALNAATMAFTSNLAKVFVGTLAIAVGIGLGMAILRLFIRHEPVDA